MNIVIPKSTLPGAVKNLANDVSEFGDVVKSFEDQKNLVTAQRIENDMKVQLDRFDAEMLKNSDGTEEKLFDKIRAGHDKIRNDYANQAPNFAVSRYLKQTGAVDGGQRLRRVQGALDEKLYKTSIDALNIKVDDEIRTALQTGEFGTGMQNVEQIIEAYGPFLGASAKAIGTGALQRYAYHYLKTGLTNPQTAPLIVQRLSDPEQKKMFYSLLPAEKIDEIERTLNSAGRESMRQTAYTVLYKTYKGNLDAMEKSLDNPKTLETLNIGIEDAMYIKGYIGRSVETREKARSLRWDKTASHVFLNLHNMNPAQIDSYVQNDQLSYQLGEHFKTQLTKVQDARSNPNTYMRIWRSIQDNVGDEDAMTKIRLEIHSSTGLSFNDKMMMLKKTEDEKDKHDASLVKRGSTYIERVVMPSKGTFFTKAVEEEKLIKAMSAYEEAVKKARQEKGILTADDINKIAADVADAYVMTPTEAVEESVKANKERQAKRELKKKEETGEKDKYGFVINGSSRIINGVTWIYIGNNQWQKK